MKRKWSRLESTLCATPPGGGWKEGLRMERGKRRKGVKEEKDGKRIKRKRVKEGKDGQRKKKEESRK